MIAKSHRKCSLSSSCILNTLLQGWDVDTIHQREGEGGIFSKGEMHLGVILWMNCNKIQMTFWELLRRRFSFKFPATKLYRALDEMLDDVHENTRQLRRDAPGGALPRVPRQLSPLEQSGEILLLKEKMFMLSYFGAHLFCTFRWFLFGLRAG